MDALFDIQDLRHRYPGFELSIDRFSLEPGSIVGLIGPNGAGKSTWIRILMGMIRADAGKVRLLGHPIPERETEAKRRVGFLSEDLSLYEALPVGWHLDFVRRLSPDWDPSYATDLLRRLKLDPAALVGTLSRGTRIKLQLLLALAKRPALLLLDEPTSGLDPVVRAEFLEELMQLVVEEERGVLFSSHITTDVERCADRIVFLNQGRIVADEGREELIDRWRVVRLAAPAHFNPPERCEVVRVERQGPVWQLTLRGFGPTTEADLRRAGASEIVMQRLSLEEIFLASLRQTESGAVAATF